MTTPQVAPNAANLLLGRGALYFDRFVAGTMNEAGGGPSRERDEARNHHHR